MNIKQLPDVILNDIHHRVYNCDAVGLQNAPCNENQIPITTTNIFTDQVNQETCCRNIHQFQPYFTARQNGLETLAARILASFRANEASPEIINTFLSENTQQGHFAIVRRLLDYTGNMNFTGASWMEATHDVLAFKKMMSKQPIVAFDTIDQVFSISIDRLVVSYPRQKNQLWKVYTGTLKSETVYDCSEAFGKMLSTLNDQNILLSYDDNIPNLPGIVIRYSGTLYEHCCYPILTLLFSMLQSHQESYNVAMSMMGHFSDFLLGERHVDMTVLESFWRYSQRCFPLNEIYSDVNFFRQVRFNIFSVLKHTLRRRSCFESFIVNKYKENNFSCHFSHFTDVFYDFHLSTDVKRYIFTKLLEFSLPQLRRDEVIMLVRYAVRGDLHDAIFELIQKCNVEELQISYARVFVERLFTESLQVNNMNPNVTEAQSIQKAVQIIQLVLEKYKINTLGGINMKTVKVGFLGLQANTQYTNEIRKQFQPLDIIFS